MVLVSSAMFLGLTSEWWNVALAAIAALFAGLALFSSRKANRLAEEAKRSQQEIRELEAKQLLEKEAREARVARRKYAAALNSQARHYITSKMSGYETSEEPPSDLELSALSAQLDDNSHQEIFGYVQTSIMMNPFAVNDHVSGMRLMSDIIREVNAWSENPETSDASSQLAFSEAFARQDEEREQQRQTSE